MRKLALLVFVLAAPLGAQETRGQIVGRVQDVSEAVITGPR